MAIPQRDIEDILFGGSFPLIVAGVTEGTSDAKLSLRLGLSQASTEWPGMARFTSLRPVKSRRCVKMIPSSPDRKYVAISHVWADGMGNQLSNEIPMCQFNQISKMLQVTAGTTDIHFWFDTLCFLLATRRHTSKQWRQ